jgi:hypothetical protein
MRRDRRSEDCVLELSRSHPTGVICGKGRKEEHSEESLCQESEEQSQEWAVPRARCAHPRLPCCGGQAYATITARARAQL